jgi:para-aminobenzoate synthetase / 4-amino-4-deoxychorismate lyase
VYCGAIGHVRPGGDCAFSVAIRTVVADAASGRATYGTGGGVTWDSAAGAEHGEAIDKARILTARAPRFELLETMRLERGAVARRARHLARLADSARYFGFPSDAAERADVVLAALEADHARTPGAPPQRLRLTVDEAGTPRVTCSALADEASAAPRAVRLARTPVRRDDVFLHHKTTHREAYDVRRAEWPAAFDVLLFNEEGEVTELTIGNVVVELDGRRVTPPRDCGLLAGTFRAELLERGEVRERVVRLPELLRATRLWLVNSVRAWVEVRIER